MLPFPAHLVPGLDARTLTESEASIAIIRPDGAIVWVNPAWERFALESGAPSARVPADYYDGITEPLRSFYRNVFAQAAATHQVFEEVYDCSSPEARRIFRCRALPVDDALVLEHSLVIEAELDPSVDAELFERYAASEGVLLQCSHCRRVRGETQNVWSWMSAWAVRPHPRTSHVICPLCADFFWGRRRRTPAPAIEKEDE